MSRFALTPFEERNLEFFRDFFNLRPLTTNSSPSITKLNVDIEDKGDYYELKADLPGFNQEDIKIEVEDDILTIQASMEEEKDSKEKNYIFKERSSGYYMRRFDVSGIDSDEITGSFINGVVTINMPKLQEELKTSKQIELSSEE